MTETGAASGIERRMSASCEETRAFGSLLATRLPRDAILLLYGDLGSGKTVVAQGIGAALGLEAGSVQSPSYTLINEYKAPGGRLVHVDLYRLEPDELAALGLEEVLDGPGLKVVEWAERIDFPLPGAWRLRLRPGAVDDARLLELEPPQAGPPDDETNDTRRT